MADSKHPAPAATVEEVAERRKASEVEWGTYVALVPIGHGGALAYRPGDPVPVSNVERHGYLEQGVVAKQDSKAAQDMIRGLYESQTAQPVDVAPVTLGVTLKN